MCANEKETKQKCKLSIAKAVLALKHFLFVTLLNICRTFEGVQIVKGKLYRKQSNRNDNMKFAKIKPGHV